MADDRLLWVMTQRKCSMETAQQANAERSQRQSDRAGAASRRPYRTPQLTVFGNLRGITLGGSPGNSDSGDMTMSDMIFFTDNYNGLP